MRLFHFESVVRWPSVDTKGPTCRVATIRGVQPSLPGIVIPNAYSGPAKVATPALQVGLGFVAGFVLSMIERALLALVAESYPRILFGMLIAFISGLCCA